jgi:phosphonate dehydrogenase
MLYGRGLAGSSVAVLGMGCVGRAIAERLRGFGCRLLGADRITAMPGGVEGATLDMALVQGDLLIQALPLNDSTLHLIDKREIARARRGALWVNVGRGSVVDEAAMARHLAPSDAINRVGLRA